MYKMIVCKYGSECYTKTGKAEVLNKFICSYLPEINKGRIDYYKTRIIVFFPGKYSAKFILPISCKKYFTEV